MEKEIYLIRHLPTSMNKSGAYMGREYDPPILEGETGGLTKRLDYLKEWMKLESPVFYSSPALRCLQTLDIIKKHLGFSEFITETDPNFLETDFGEISGLTIPEIKERFPDVYNAWDTDQSKTVFPKGETYQDVQERSWLALQEVIKNSPDASSIFLCSHVDVIKMILFKAVDISISNKPLLIIPNGCICTLVISKSTFKIKLY